MKRYTTVIFDLDGTLLNTLDDLADSVNYALSSCGLPERSIDEVRNFVGNGVRRLMFRAVPGGEQNPVFERAFSCFKEHYLHNSVNKTCPYEGIMALLAKLKRYGIAMAVVSNKLDVAVNDLNRRFFADFISVAIGDRENFRRKPAPDSVLEALRMLGKTAEESVYIGDSEVDIETARNAGIDCISVSWGFREEKILRDSGAVRIAHTPEELGNMLIPSTQQ